MVFGRIRVGGVLAARSVRQDGIFQSKSAFSPAVTALLLAASLLGCANRTPPDAGTARPAMVPTFASKIRAVPGLAEPLVSTAATSDAEDQALARATAGHDGAAAPLVAFLAAYPHSGWSAAIHTNLGLAYYQRGFFSKAIAAYEAAYREGRAATDFRARALVDRAIGELARMHARVGHLAELDALTAEIGDRPIQGGAAELLTGAREGAWTMHHNPGISYLCGPKALRNVLETLGAAPRALAVVDEARSGEHGFSLAQVSALADQAGLKHRLIYRRPGQPVPVPSVIHWKLSHYAAIVRRTERGTYEVKDPTFGGDLDISEDAIDEEGSGFFLVPVEPSTGATQLAWRDATPSEATHVYGMGFPNAYLLGAVKICDALTSIFLGAPATGLCNGLASLIPTNPDCASGGMCAPTAHAMEVSLNLKDTPVGYAPPVGPPAFIRLAYNQREAVEPFGPPTSAVSFNVGPQWTLNVLSYVRDNPTSPGATVSRYVPGGGAISAYTGYSTLTGAFDAEDQSGAILSRTPATGVATSYTLTGTDGSRLVYAQSDGAAGTATVRRMFLTSIVDPSGNALTLNYDTTLVPAGSSIVLPRLVGMTDPLGTTAMTFSYDLSATPLLVTAITDAFGRSARITYDANGRLSSITDVLGITSTMTYDDASTPPRPTFVKQLTTPYGTTSFNFTETNSGSAVVMRSLETTDPLGQTERVEFAEATTGGSTGIPAADEIGNNLPQPAGMPLSNAQAAGLLQFRNTFFWNKHIFKAFGTGATKDYTRAEIVHWLHTSNGADVATSIESTRRPLERRTWYQYSPSQTSAVFEGPPATFLAVPTTVARVLDDGTTQLTAIARNPLGKPTLVTDPLGRQTRFTYAANNTDLLEVEQRSSATTFSSLGRFTYDTRHLPLSFTDAAGQTTRYSYNDKGQLVAVADALGNTQTLVYDSAARPSQLLDARNLPALTLTYDARNRVATRSDASGLSISYAYDDFDRVTTASYADGTSEKFAYTNLDLASTTDRLGRVTTYTHDADRRLTSVTDALNRVTKYAYFEDGTLKSIADPNGNTTSWDIDIQSRPVVKHYADGTSESYAYEASTGRLKSKTDAFGQVTSYGYTGDDRLASISYSNLSSGVAPTPGVSFTYDSLFPRVTSMTDGIGTTTYSYYPMNAAPGAGRLQFVASPVAGAPGGAVDVIAYTYDALGRVTGRSINGSTQGVALDALGRPTEVANALDTFKYAYADETSRPTAVASLAGPQLALSYFDPATHPEANALVQQMTFSVPGGNTLLSQFGYTYYPDGSVKTFTETRPGPTSPLAMQAAAGTVRPPRAAAPRSTAAAGALVVVTVLLVIAALGCVGVGRPRRALRARISALALVLITCGGSGSNAPSPSVPAQVTAYAYDAAHRLTSATIAVGDMPPAPGAPPQFAYAYDAASNPTRIAAGGATQSPTYTATNAVIGGNYDPDGNPRSLNGAQYTWDAANRLASAVVNGVESDFTYDGASRIVRIVEKQAGRTLADKAYTWSGSSRVLEHDNTRSGSPVSKEYFAQGVLDHGQPLYYTSDRLGSVRQLVDSTGTVRAQYDYDPYGNRKKLTGDLDSDYGPFGLFQHPSSGLDLSLTRAYGPDVGRWLNRDPIGEAGGLNLYAYAGGDPATNVDPTGLLELRVKGTFVHIDFSDEINGRDDLNKVFVANKVLGALGLRPDVQELETGNILELKPESNMSGSSYTKAKNQVGGYCEASGGAPGNSLAFMKQFCHNDTGQCGREFDRAGFTFDVNYFPDPNPGTGLIFYSSTFRPSDGTVRFVGAASKAGVAAGVLFLGVLRFAPLAL